jgi:hypothetical protein
MQQTAAGGGGLGNGTVAKECLFQPKVCLCGTFRDGRAFRRSVTAVGTSGKSAARLRPVNPPELNRTRCPTVRHTRSLVPPHTTPAFGGTGRCAIQRMLCATKPYCTMPVVQLSIRPLYYTIHTMVTTHTHTQRERERETKTATRIPKCVSGVCTYWERC